MYISNGRKPTSVVLLESGRVDEGTCTTKAAQWRRYDGIRGWRGRSAATVNLGLLLRSLQSCIAK